MQVYLLENQPADDLLDELAAAILELGGQPEQYRAVSLLIERYIRLVARISAFMEPDDYQVSRIGEIIGEGYATGSDGVGR